ncbi:hypothetical protein LSH36_62g04040 [Paralvinella palmiformis]|uniref:Ig-like domain-containing protein n=1 Tax=Paralvinella palmiformis TaxID=53620 RepID=A0AAD9NDG0_9ANNE|nr:hypothetical protein LSH36_62g04040 [Paralvinella palmiformis]
MFLFPAPYFIDPPYNATVLVDQEFILPCRVAGSPKPTIKWWNAYEEMRRHGSNYRIQKSGNLKFMRILPQHRGYYRCLGSNVNGKVISNYAYLQVDGMRHSVIFNLRM